MRHIIVILCALIAGCGWYKAPPKPAQSNAPTSDACVEQAHQTTRANIPTTCLILKCPGDPPVLLFCDQGLWEHNGHGLHTAGGTL